MQSVAGLQGEDSRAGTFNIALRDGAGRTAPGLVETAITRQLMLPQGVSTLLAAARPGRRASVIQCISENKSFHVRPNDSPATGADQLVLYGDVFSFPSGVTYTGAIFGYTTAAPPVMVVVVDYYLVPEEGTM